jgi:large subunit ribosomal protein L6
MSRIGKQPITIPAKVKVEVKGQKVLVEGPKGKLNWELPGRTSLKIEGTTINVTRQGEDKQSRALHGLSRALINNMVKGVSDGFLKKLEINGVGFKAAVTGKTITMSLGYSHPIIYDIPEQIKVVVEENTKISIEGPDKQLVGKVASELRSYYPPEPYKGKGVKYSDEKIVRKEGKTVQ